jgi:hypothetical protein
VAVANASPQTGFERRWRQRSLKTPPAVSPTRSYDPRRVNPPSDCQTHSEGCSFGEAKTLEGRDNQCRWLLWVKSGRSHPVCPMVIYEGNQDDLRVIFAPLAARIGPRAQNWAPRTKELRPPLYFQLAFLLAPDSQHHAGPKGSGRRQIKCPAKAAVLLSRCNLPKFGSGRASISASGRPKVLFAD